MDLKMIRDAILLGAAILLCILAIIGIANSVGCKTTTEISHDEVVRDAKMQDDMQRMMWMENMPWRFAHGSANGKVEEDRYALFYFLEYDEDPRTGICFAFYKGVPFATVPCGYARDAIPK